MLQEQHVLKSFLSYQILSLHLVILLYFLIYFHFLNLFYFLAFHYIQTHLKLFVTVYCDSFFLFKSFLHLDKRFNNEFRPILVLGLILFCSINFFDAISNEHLFNFAKLFIAFTVVSPIDLFGTFRILSKDKSS